jgi:hypothetical protein
MDALQYRQPIETRLIDALKRHYGETIANTQMRRHNFFVVRPSRSDTKKDEIAGTQGAWPTWKVGMCHIGFAVKLEVPPAVSSG